MKFIGLYPTDEYRLSISNQNCIKKIKENMSIMDYARGPKPGRGNGIKI